MYIKVKPEEMQYLRITLPMSYEANWELVTFLVRNIPIDGEQCKYTYETSYIYGERCEDKLIIAVMYTTWAAVTLRPEKNRG